MIETWNDGAGHVGPGPDGSGAGSPSTAGIDLRFELVLRAHRHGSQRLGSAECRATAMILLWFGRFGSVGLIVWRSCRSSDPRNADSALLL